MRGEMFNEAILSRAKKLVASFDELGIDSAPIAVGEVEGAMMVSSDPTKVVGNMQFAVDGKMYYIGLSTDEIGE